MKIKSLLLALPVLATLLPLTAQAQNINERQHHQQGRIIAGQRSGSLNGRESVRLETRQTQIARQESRNRRSGGRFTPTERHQIGRELNRSNRAIYTQRHDGQYYQHSGTINGRQSYQNGRVQSGIRRGSLTRLEAQRIREREARIRRSEASDRRSGHYLSPAERRNIQRRLNATSHSIYNQKHDRQRR